jgi:DNA-binding XRE family transcriptional regulator
MSEITSHLTDAQMVRCARALLDWSQAQLAERAGVTKSTICNMERDNFVRGVHQMTRRAIFRTLLEAGIDFSPTGVHFCADRLPHEVTAPPRPERRETTNA